MIRVPAGLASGLLALTLLVSGCGLSRPAPPEEAFSFAETDLYPGETPHIRRLIRASAAELDIQEALIHRVVQRESDYNPAARNGPYWGMMQILPQTARQMGHEGPASDLLDPATTLRYAGRYLRGAWLVSDGDIDAAVGWYARGYYYEARNRCLLVETGLLDHEVARHCR